MLLEFVTGVTLVGATVAAPLPPLSAYLEQPQILSPAIAPDGHAVAFVATRNNVQEIDVYGPGGELIGATRSPGGEVDGVDWIDNAHVAIGLINQEDRANRWPRILVNQIVSWNVQNKSLVTLLANMPETAPIVAGGGLLMGRYHQRSVVFMVGLNRGPAFDLFAADAETGRGERVAEGDLQSLNWATTTTGEPLAKTERDPDAGTDQLFVRQAGGWRLVPLPAGGFNLVGLGAAPGSVLLRRSSDWVQVAVDGSTSPPLAPDDRLRPYAVFDHASGRLIALTTGDTDVSPVFFDKALSDAWPGILKAFPKKAIRILSVDDARQNVVVYTSGEQDAGSYYWIDLKKKSATLIDNIHPTLQGRLAQVEPFSFSASDGVQLSGTLTYPTVKANTAPAAVVLMDGSADLAGYNGLAQGLASRGYAVVRVAFRGATGQSVALHLAGHGELGRRMQTDVSDAVAALEQRGRIAPGRVCIFGEGSYDGYAALAGVILQHGIYRCAIAGQPTDDLQTVVRRLPSNSSGSGWSVDYWRDALGDAAGDWGELRARSPLLHAINADAPVLILTQSIDPQNTARGANMATALQRAGKPVEEQRIDPKIGILGLPRGNVEVLERTAAYLAVHNPVGGP